MTDKPIENHTLSISIVDATPQMCGQISSLLQGEGYKKVSVLTSPQKTLSHLSDSKLIMITADTAPSIVQTAILAGANHSIVQPCANKL
ncbi:hypothetical protein P8S54_03660 [Thiomicrospira sp. R3]|uniref:hypothetical protein n=1 Tax=Thiomicrospira sp. R3 TaxID=3035472 RepID=UPI00259B4FF1|nr:hypothetical protein [Thiomicrospira sp. R3]WFE69404.1 hypothetical protein P8S54_03660 [Thiomicrospira sp. R3]